VGEQGMASKRDAEAYQQCRSRSLTADQRGPIVATMLPLRSVSPRELYSQKVLAETTATKRMQANEPVLWCIGQNKIYGEG
jgi:hypothetical protein